MARTFEHIQVSTSDDGIGTITMNRPDRRNALSESHLDELALAFADLGAAPEVRAIILAANGPVFCAGHDFSDMAERDLGGMRQLLTRCTDVLALIQRVPVPVVAQVQGIATAAGCQLVATCDLAVAADHATFATPGGKGGWFCTTPMVAVARAVAPKRALELLFTGDAIDAPTALAWGLVNRIVPATDLAHAARDLALRASRGSRQSKAVGKDAFYATAALDVEAAYAQAVEVMAASALTEDGREMMRAFLEKRPAVYPIQR
jgi:enoyl-CoA hydratase/carnithine racemase